MFFTARQRRTPQPELTDRHRTHSTGRSLVRMMSPSFVPWLAGGMLAVWLWPAIDGHLPKLDNRPEYLVGWRDIHVTQPPAWIPGQIVQEVLRNGDFPERLRLLHPELTRELSEAFERNPWVESVKTVRKSFPARVDIDLVYRQPIAMVVVDSGEFAVDGEGILLPLPRMALEEAASYPRIEGAKTSPQGLNGQPWGDRIVEDAARLAATLAPHWKAMQLETIVCPKTSPRANSLDDGVYQLRTRDGSRIVWGHPPGSDHPGDLATDKKIGRILDYHAKFGPFGASHGTFRIDIRPFQAITRTPFSSAEGRDVPVP